MWGLRSWLRGMCLVGEGWMQMNRGYDAMRERCGGRVECRKWQGVYFRATVGMLGISYLSRGHKTVIRPTSDKINRQPKGEHSSFMMICMYCIACWHWSLRRFWEVRYNEPRTWLPALPVCPLHHQRRDISIKLMRLLYVHRIRATARPELLNDTASPLG